MKRFLLITAGTVGGLGAVLSVTPPQLGSSAIDFGSELTALPTPDTTTQAPTPSQSATSTATKAATPTKTTAAKPTSVATSTTAASTPAAAQTQTQSAAPAPTPTVKTISGDFAGPVVNTRYGNVQVEITVTNGKITNAIALLAPTGKNDRYTRFAIPVLKQQTLAAQSTDIQGASGASYTTYGWRLSLQGAMAKAGL
ncbi:hypothetical protein GM50_19040 [freshwater metagenome]|uniref:FMN-binding domain-containing protein n=1 Tax=freshwater metagenome TaxID=449393 RepID=A0A094QJX7_9ZZZZ